MSTHDRIPVLCGADVELGNFILGIDRLDGTGHEASRALLREVDAPYADRRGPVASMKKYDPQDWGRKFLATSGGCTYVDLNHLELCLPEVLSAWDHVAAWHAMLRVAQRALVDANAKLPPGQTLHVLVNNTDGRGNAYGSHLNFALSRRAFDNIFERKMHHLLFLAAFQVSSIVFTGAGKVGAENGRPDVAFQLSQRADFFETLVGTQTTHRRPIVNSRDEPLCGTGALDVPRADVARLHSIFFDSTLCHGSSLLKVGTMQLVIGLLEAERVDLRLLLDDPIAALVRWSRDPGLQARARLVSGQALTAVELQERFLDEARRFADAGGYDGIVPRAAEIIALWEDTLVQLRARNFEALASRVDWVLRRWVLDEARRRRPGLDWTSPELKHLDHLYASLDPASGLYWAYEQAGAVERWVSEDAIERFVHEPPEDTRAWGRAMLLRLAGADRVEDVDWDRIRFREVGRGYWPMIRTVHMPDPFGFTKAGLADVLDGARSFDDVLQALGASPPTYDATPTLAQWCAAQALEVRRTDSQKGDDDDPAGTTTRGA